MNKIYFIIVLLSQLKPLITNGQEIQDTINAKKSFFIEVGGFGSSIEQTPFWFRTRQYGITPLKGPAIILRSGVTAKFGDWQNYKKIRFKIGIEGTAGLGPNKQINLPVAYASFLLGNFEFYGGRRREVFGLYDTLLSSGSYAWSGNALPITKLQLGTRGFTPLKFTKGIVAINALYAHGWFGQNDSVQGAFLHQKAFFGRINLLKEKLKLYAGITHYAQWGGRRSLSTVAVNGQLPNTLKDYWLVIRAAETPTSDSASYTEIDRLNRVGNHLGSIDFALELNSNRSNWFFYYQHPYEDKSGVAFQNLPDGLYGLRWRNKNSLLKVNFRFLQATVELLTTLNQSGFNIDSGSRLYAGADDYFNNYQYTQGWTNQLRVIGTPFITRTTDSRPDLANLKGGFGPIYLNNNRVQVVHLGLSGVFYSGVHLRTLISYSQNYGRPIIQDFRAPFSQVSTLGSILIPTKLLAGAQLEMSIAIDHGNWLLNNIGGEIRLHKQINEK